jgi:hypothetical protein
MAGQISTFLGDLSSVTTGAVASVQSILNTENAQRIAAANAAAIVAQANTRAQITTTGEWLGLVLLVVAAAIVGYIVLREAI